MLVQKIKKNFVSLGYAPWIYGKGLQVNNTHTIEDGLTGIYVMIDDLGQIQKIGKSSSSLKTRLNSYKSFDASLETSIKNGKRQDESSLRQRKAIIENNITGMYVYFYAAKKIETNEAGVNTIQHSFCAHDFETRWNKMAKSENHPLKFGSK